MKRIARLFGIVLVLLLAIAIALPFLIDANQFRPALESQLTTALGRQVNLGDLKVSLFSGGVFASDLAIADDPAFSKTPFLRAQSLTVGVEMLPLILSRKLNVTGITIDHPQIDLVETPAGVFNFSSIGVKSRAASTQDREAPAQPAQTPDVSIALLKIADGRIALEKTGSKNKPLILDKLNLEVKNFAVNARFPFSLSAALSGGGTIRLDGRAGPIEAGEIANTPFNARLTVSHLDFTGSGLMDPATGIAGIASVDGSAESAKATINVTGKLKAEQLTLVKGGAAAKRPVEVDLVISHNLGKQSGEVRRMAIHLGSAAANLSGTYRLETEPAIVNLKLTGSKMPLTELATFLPPLNIALPSGASIDQGTAELNLSSEGPLDKLITQGTLGAENARLANYDFASKLQVLHEFTGIKAQPHTLIQTLSTNVKNTREGTVLDNVQFAIASIGAIAGAGTISPSHALDFKMRAALGGEALASLGGKGGIPFTIQGTAENPSFKPDVKGMVTDKLKDLTGGKSPADAATGLLNGIFGSKKKQ
jgi:AsmA protein